MSIPNCTLTTACFCLKREHSGARSLSETVDLTEALLKLPIYLVIYGDEKTIPLLKEKRIRYGFESLTVFKETKPSSLWSFQYLEKVRQNRELYFPTRDERTSSETHLVTCNKFTFVLETIEANPFQTTRFGWIDAFLGKDTVKICEDYTPRILPWITTHISDKFQIQVLNVCDKKYKQKENKREFYSKYQWVVCGGFFTCGIDSGRRVLSRLNEIFVETTTMGYGHGEEMFYLEVLDELHEYISVSYGDYGQMLNNFIYPTRNFHYIYYFILRKYMEKEYWREAYHCSSALLYSLENHWTQDAADLVIHILLDHYISAYHYIPQTCRTLFQKIETVFLKNPPLKAIYEREKYRIEWYLNSIQEVYTD
jgi:hypothetical protein